MLITSTKDISVGRLKILVFGDSGVGKTTLAGTMPPKTLIFSMESGLLSLGDKDISVFDVTTNDKGEIIPRGNRQDRMTEGFLYLSTKDAREKFDNIFIDSLSEISDNLYERLKLKFPERKDGLNLWEEHKTEMRKTIRAFRDLPGYNVVFTALETKIQDDNSRLFIGPYVQPKSMSEELPKYFDFVHRLEVVEAADKSKARMLRTQPTETIRAKSRTNANIKLNDLEPANLSALFNKITQGV